MMKYILTGSVKKSLIGLSIFTLFVLLINCARDRLFVDSQHINYEILKEVYPEISDAYDDLIAIEVIKNEPEKKAETSLKNLSKKTETLKNKIGSDQFEEQINQLINKARIDHNIPREYLDPAIDKLQEAALNKNPDTVSMFLVEAYKAFTEPLKSTNIESFRQKVQLAEIARVKREGIPVTNIKNSFEEEIKKQQPDIQEILENSDLSNNLDDINSHSTEGIKALNELKDSGLECIQMTLSTRYSTQEAYAIASIIDQNTNENNGIFHPEETKKAITSMVKNSGGTYDDLIASIEHCHINMVLPNIPNFCGTITDIIQENSDPRELSDAQKTEFIEQAPQALKEIEDMGKELDKIDRQLKKEFEQKQRKLENIINQQYKIEELRKRFQCTKCENDAYRAEHLEKCIECDLLKEKARQLKEKREKVEKEIKEIENRRKKIMKFKLSLAALALAIAIALAAMGQWQLAAGAFALAMALSTGGGSVGGEGGNGGDGSGDGTEYYSEYGKGAGGGKGGDGQTDDPVTNGPKSGDGQTDDPVTNGPKSSDGQTNDLGTNDPKSSNGQTNDPVTNGPKSSDGQTNDPGTNDPKSSNGQINNPGENGDKTGKESQKKKGIKKGSSFHSIPGDDWTAPKPFQNSYYEVTYVGNKVPAMEGVRFLLNLPRPDKVKSLCGGDAKNQIYTGILNSGQMFKTILVEEKEFKRDKSNAIRKLVEDPSLLLMECKDDQTDKACCDQLKESQAKILDPTLLKRPEVSKELKDQDEPTPNPTPVSKKKPVNPDILPKADVQKMKRLSAKSLRKAEAIDDPSSNTFRKMERDGATYFIGFSLEDPHNEIEIYKVGPDGNNQLVAKALRNLPVHDNGEIKQGLKVHISKICAIEPPTGKPRKLIGVDASGEAITYELVEGDYPTGTLPPGKYIWRTGVSKACKN
ncbi:MAG: hypothetical protein MI974_29950 [Chitinophagales bacterium]|nr:hypothetical protein [Chitinophagales bacterium]